MTHRTYELHGYRVLACSPETPVDSERAAADLLGLAFGEDADIVAVPVEGFSSEFFRLSSRLAGSVAQKFVNYGRRLVVVGELRELTASSQPLRDWVYESNRGTHLWFVADEAELHARLAADPQRH